MPRYEDKDFPGFPRYVCDNCGKGKRRSDKMGGGLIITRNKLPALVFCKKECKIQYESKQNNKA